MLKVGDKIYCDNHEDTGVVVQTSPDFTIYHDNWRDGHRGQSRLSIGEQAKYPQGSLWYERIGISHYSDDVSKAFDQLRTEVEDGL